MHKTILFAICLTVSLTTSMSFAQESTTVKPPGVAGSDDEGVKKDEPSTDVKEEKGEEKKDTPKTTPKTTVKTTPKTVIEPSATDVKNKNDDLEKRLQKKLTPTTPKPTTAKPKNKPQPIPKNRLKTQPTPKLGPIKSQFSFGSYARVRAASDLEGSVAKPTNVVSFGSRIDEYSYAELEFAQRFEVPNLNNTFFVQAITTLAFGRNLFHLTGDFDQSVAMRNLYGEAGWKLLDNALSVTFWAGSRMYRGDDIYLLDFWPLDNLNTLGGGGGITYNLPSFGKTSFKAHAGINRPLNAFQYQEVNVPGLDVGADRIIYLDRQRLISSYKLQQDIWLAKDAKQNPLMGLKVGLYGETHSIDEGTRRTEDGLGTETLPSEDGYKAGAQVGFWTQKGFFKGSFANIFYAHTSDLAAYGEFGVPVGVNDNKTSEGANAHMLALSSNIETPYAGMLLGAYYRTFEDADTQTTDDDDYWEAIIASRLHVYATRHIHPGIEVSYQVRKPSGPSARTNQFESPSVTKLSFIQAITLDRGMYSRPQLRFIYTQKRLNQSALALYNTENPLSQRATQHYMGVMVEWWFNNASLFRP